MAAIRVAPALGQAAADAGYRLRTIALTADEQKTFYYGFATIREQDIFSWADSFLRGAIAKDLSAFPLPEGGRCLTNEDRFVGEAGF